jgi:hypothetical protein
MIIQERPMTTAEKLDLYQKHKAEYVTPKSPVLLDIRPASYLAIEGQGDPGGAVFQSKIGSLYPVAFTIKMAKKFAGRDYTVCKLEGLWWAGRKGCEFAALPPSEWNWKLLIRVPTFIRQKDLDTATEALTEKGKGPGVSEVRLETIEEGRCVQMLHVGPYARVTATSGWGETANDPASPGAVAVHPRRSESTIMKNYCDSFCSVTCLGSLHGLGYSLQKLRRHGCLANPALHVDHRYTNSHWSSPFCLHRGDPLNEVREPLSDGGVRLQDFLADRFPVASAAPHQPEHRPRAAGTGDRDQAF